MMHYRLHILNELVLGFESQAQLLPPLFHGIRKHRLLSAIELDDLRVHGSQLNKSLVQSPFNAKM